MVRFYVKNAVSWTALFMLPIIVFVSTIDDEVNPEVVAAVHATVSVNESEAYLYLMGIKAPEDTDPAELGREILELTDDIPAEKIIELDEDTDILPKPTGPLFCNYFKEGCLNSLFTTDFDIGNISLEHRTLISRAEHFFRFNEFRTLTKPSPDEIIPDAGYLSSAERIKVLGAISNHKEGRSDLAVKSLMDQMTNLRQAMERQDNLFGRLVFLAKLSEVLDVASIILTDSQPGTIYRIPQMTPNEKNFKLIAAREFVVGYDLMQGLTDPPKDSFGHRSVRWLMRTVYKPNMSVNAVFPKYQRLALLSQLSHREFARAVENNGVVGASTPLIRNALGNYFIDETPSYDKYVVRFFDFDAKISLFNHRYYSNGGFVTAGNPYYPDEALEVLTDRVCFRGPFEDNKMKCLRTTVDFVATQATRSP